MLWGIGLALDHRRMETQQGSRAKGHTYATCPDMRLLLNLQRSHMPNLNRR
jgi:hypothetical protein